MKWIFALLVTFLAAAPAARAQDGSANLLLLQCDVATSSGRGIEAVACTEFLAGILQGALIAANVAGKPAPFCGIKAGTTSGQLAFYYVDWARKNPAALRETRDIAAYAALKDAFPCQP